MEWFDELIARIIGPVQAWLATRRYHLLLEAAPAILIVIMLFVAIADQRGIAKVRNIARYHSAFTRSLESDDLQAAELYAQKLGQLDPAGPDARFGAAWLAERNGDLPRALQRMQELAPRNDTGHPRAHYWIAQKMLQQTAGLTAQDVDSLIHHLECSLQRDSKRQETVELLAKLSLQAKDFTRAIKYFDEAYRRRPELRLALAETYRAAGQPQKFRDEVESACKQFRKEVDAHPNDLDAIVRLTKALALNGQFDAALELLRPFVNDSNPDELGRLLTAVCVAKYDQSVESDQITLAAKLEILQQALTTTPADPAALARLAAFVTTQGKDLMQAQDMLKDILARGEVPAAVHLVLGTAAADAKNWDEAKLHLELAQRLEPKTAAILNNLAWVVAHSNPPDLERALELANAAMGAAPNHPEILATRGTILMLLQRPRDALIDLELAVSKLPDRTSVHQALAGIYQELGDPQLAEKHRALASKTSERQEKKGEK